MKYCVMSVALPVSLALCPQPVLPPKRAMGGRLPCWDGRVGAGGTTAKDATATSSSS